MKKNTKQQIKKHLVKNIAYFSVIMLFLIISACVPTASSSSKNSSGIARTYGTVNHYINRSNRMHAWSPFSPCSTTLTATTDTCKNCHGNGTNLDGQIGWSDGSTTYNTQSCTNCHGVLWADDAKWDSVGSVCIP